ncbi:nascent polypeptide-associated complex subunit alpha, muscle-specific form isoform X3 [Lethenteron reissneri]|uniref:nascent polypeptide-associated complex subunit alpha, muscle-specific form isoform X3 n=1 Tax=Lethenteron reissneri TaxID=7753 RepID=UPI002AB7102F|nr:nascent polypeptide-associated complex subunit alpha, muscle-specific form isoform X3 [Lethenteron reissneri]
MLLPSDIARLVLGYLQQEQLAESCRVFVQESPHLREYALHSAGDVVSPVCVLSLFGRSLTSILEEYIAIKAKADVSSNPAGVLCVLWKRLEQLLTQIREYQNASGTQASADERGASSVRLATHSSRLPEPASVAKSVAKGSSTASTQSPVTASAVDTRTLPPRAPHTSTSNLTPASSATASAALLMPSSSSSPLLLISPPSSSTVLSAPSSSSLPSLEPNPPAMAGVQLPLVLATPPSDCTAVTYMLAQPSACPVQPPSSAPGTSMPGQALLSSLGSVLRPRATVTPTPSADICSLLGSSADPSEAGPATKILAGFGSSLSSRESGGREVSSTVLRSGVLVRQIVDPVSQAPGILASSASSSSSGGSSSSTSSTTSPSSSSSSAHKLSISLSVQDQGGDGATLEMTAESLSHQVLETALETLLGDSRLQEKLAENINQVFYSETVVTVTDAVATPSAPSADNGDPQSIEDFLNLQGECNMSRESIQDIVTLTQSDPAFHSLFQLFDLGTQGGSSGGEDESNEEMDEAEEGAANGEVGEEEILGGADCHGDDDANPDEGRQREEVTEMGEETERHAGDGGEGGDGGKGDDVRKQGQCTHDYQDVGGEVCLGDESHDKSCGVPMPPAHLAHETLTTAIRTQVRDKPVDGRAAKSKRAKPPTRVALPGKRLGRPRSSAKSSGKNSPKVSLKKHGAGKDATGSQGAVVDPAVGVKAAAPVRQGDGANVESVMGGSGDAAGGAPDGATGTPAKKKHPRKRAKGKKLAGADTTVAAASASAVTPAGPSLPGASEGAPASVEAARRPAAAAAPDSAGREVAGGAWASDVELRSAVSSITGESAATSDAGGGYHYPGSPGRPLTPQQCRPERHVVTASPLGAPAIRAVLPPADRRCPQQPRGGERQRHQSTPERLHVLAAAPPPVSTPLATTAVCGVTVSRNADAPLCAIATDRFWGTLVPSMPRHPPPLAMGNIAVPAATVTVSTATHFLTTSPPKNITMRGTVLQPGIITSPDTGPTFLVRPVLQGVVGVLSVLGSPPRTLSLLPHQIVQLSPPRQPVAAAAAGAAHTRKSRFAASTPSKPIAISPGMSHVLLSPAPSTSTTTISSPTSQPLIVSGSSLVSGMSRICNLADRLERCKEKESLVPVEILASAHKLSEPRDAERAGGSSVSPADAAPAPPAPHRRVLTFDGVSLTRAPGGSRRTSGDAGPAAAAASSRRSPKSPAQTARKAATGDAKDVPGKRGKGEEGAGAVAASASERRTAAAAKRDAGRSPAKGGDAGRSPAKGGSAARARPDGKADRGKSKSPPDSAAGRKVGRAGGKSGPRAEPGRKGDAAPAAAAAPAQRSRKGQRRDKEFPRLVTPVIKRPVPLSDASAGAEAPAALAAVVVPRAATRRAGRGVGKEATAAAAAASTKTNTAKANVAAPAALCPLTPDPCARSPASEAGSESSVSMAAQTLVFLSQAAKSRGATATPPRRPPDGSPAERDAGGSAAVTMPPPAHRQSAQKQQRRETDGTPVSPRRSARHLLAESPRSRPGTSSGKAGGEEAQAGAPAGETRRGTKRKARGDEGGAAAEEAAAAAAAGKAAQDSNAFKSPSPVRRCGSSAKNKRKKQRLDYFPPGVDVEQFLAKLHYVE